MIRANHPNHRLKNTGLIDAAFLLATEDRRLKQISLCQGRNNCHLDSNGDSMTRILARCRTLS